MARQARIVQPKRGDVVIVDFDPTIGAEIRKTRPALVIQNDIDNRHSPITIVAAITSQLAGERYATEVVLHPPEGGLTKPAVVLVNQIRSVDKRRLVRRLGRLKTESLLRVDRALQISLGLVHV